MQQSLDAIKDEIATGNTTRTKAPRAVPVFVVYDTAFADADGKLQFRPDVYRRDAEIWQYLEPKGGAVAEPEAPEPPPPTKATTVVFKPAPPRRPPAVAGSSRKAPP
jgi:hypothetical protein